MIYTRKGDGGTTGLFGTKKRLQKNCLLIDALGNVDELVSLLGVCRSHCNTKGQAEIASQTLKIQERLFTIQAELAGASKAITQTEVDELENIIESFENKINVPKSFVIPGATPLSALFDFARAVSRRTERKVVGLKEVKNISPKTLAYLNRLSSFLYILARYEASKKNEKEMTPSYNK